jgi:Domain found in Dishevelled, Egl-10, and Pleckstrin (DEP)
VTLICLVLQQRYKRKPVLTQSNSLTSFASLENSFSDWSPKNRSFKSVVSMSSVYHQPLTRSSSMLLEAYCGDCYQTSDPDGLFSPSDNLPTYVVDLRPTLQALQSKGKLNTNQLTEPEENSIVRDRDDEFQIMRHVILLLAMGCSMFVVSSWTTVNTILCSMNSKISFQGIALCVWTLVMEELTGIYVMLLFLDETLNFGQGVFVLVVFGLEPKRLLTPVWTGLRRQMKPAALQANSSQNEQQVANDCDQFLTFYHDKCVRDLVRDRKWHLKHYTNVFCGNELVDWLLLMGLSSDRSQAERYGQHLLKGDVICHVDGRKGFHDQPYFYAFKV